MLSTCVIAQGRIASGEDVFGPLIEKYLLANKHRVTVQLLPDQQLAAKEDEEEKAQLAAFKQKLVDSELQEVIRSTQELKERQVSSLMPTLSYVLPGDACVLNCVVFVYCHTVCLKNYPGRVQNAVQCQAQLGVCICYGMTFAMAARLLFIKWPRLAVTVQSCLHSAEVCLYHDLLATLAATWLLAIALTSLAAGRAYSYAE